MILAPAGRGYSLTPKPLLRSADFYHKNGRDEPGVREIWAQLAHQLEDARILSVADDGYRSLKWVVCNERGLSEGSGIALSKEGRTARCGWTFLPVSL